MSMAVGLPDNPRLIRTGTPPKVGIVHLGPGAFFRAFNAVYTDEAMAVKGGDWGIVAVSLRSATAHEQLSPQRGVYQSVTLGQDGPKPQLVGSIVQTLVAPHDPSAVIMAMADPMVKIVSLTITEKGYCHEPATGALNLRHPDIEHDLTDLNAPVSAIGYIVAALKLRWETGAGPFTVLSCDNLPSNGVLARGTVLQFAQKVDAKLAQWIADNVTFPATMVDRITPATTPEDIAALSEQTGTTDLACVFHEGFRQWVIEDDFAAGRPDWDAVGVQFVGNVEAHELMKLRCLNGTHSTLAYLGYLAGYETIADTVADSDFAALCDMLWRDEIIPTVPQPDGEDLQAYCATLMARYKDPSIRHRTWQIAMDGSQKLPQRILGTIRDGLGLGSNSRGLSLAVAAWMIYVGGVDEKGNAIDVRDPLADALKAASDGAVTVADKVDALLAFTDVFPTQLASHPEFRDGVIAAYQSLISHGSKASVQALVRT